MNDVAPALQASRSVSSASPAGRNLPPPRSRVMAFMDGTKHHSEVAWARSGWVMLVRFDEAEPHTVADGWTRESYDSALKQIDADYADVIKWVPFSRFDEIAEHTADRKNEDRSERAQPEANTNMEGE
jgi:hypothetical protein